MDAGAFRRTMAVARARRRLRSASSLAAERDIAGATSLVERAVRVLVRESHSAGGPGPFEAAGAFQQLAELHLATFDLPSAVEALRGALSTLPSVAAAAMSAADAAWRCSTMTQLGDTFRLQGRYEEARGSLDAAMTVAGTPLLEAGVLNAQGILAKDLGRYDAAHAKYVRARDLLESELGVDAPALAPLFHNFAGLEHARGRHADGEPHIRRALDIRNADPHREDTAGVLGDRGVLAALLVGQGRHGEAEREFRELIGEWACLRGPEHYEVAHCRHHLGVLLASRGDVEAAAVQLGAALRIKHRILGENHPEVRDLAARLADTGRG